MSDPNDFVTAETTPVPAQSAPEKIGPYALLERLGEGGFGEVWLAEQHEPVRRRVAIKLVKAGMDTKAVLARFRAERQALAMLDHPNVATVHDAGQTELGRPWFSMELVRGLPITKYCDERKLSVRDRMALFIPVCQAVQHAHQKGIIHRDLKPSNIIVTEQDGRPIPKVIDFGIAKAMHGPLTDNTLFTRSGQMVGTPEYMAPEQAGGVGLDVDTRADIYSMGVVLYEMLTGTLPYDTETLRKVGQGELRQFLMDHDPAKPSTRFTTMEPGTRESVAKLHAMDLGELKRELRGDLDWITLTAMAKERDRRYETANGLAADLQRYLDGDPIAARPPTASYKFRKFASRNKAAFAGVCVITLAVLLGLGLATVGFVKATAANAALEVALEDTRAAQLAAEAARVTAESERNRAVEAEAVAQVQRDAAESARAEAVSNLALAERRAYLSSVGAASMAIDRYDLGTAELLLDQAPETHRGWEWDLLRSRLDESVSVIEPVEPGQYSVAISPDGSRAARIKTVAAEGDTIEIIDTRSGTVVAELGDEVVGGTTFRLAFSADGRYLYHQRQDWRDGYVFDVDRRERIRFGAEDADHPIWMGRVLGLSPDGSRVAVSYPETNSVRIASLPEGEEICMLRESEQTAESDIVFGQTAEFSPDGSLVALGGGSPNAFRVYDAETGARVATLRDEDWVSSVSFSSDGSLMAAYLGDPDRQSIHVWETGGWTDILTIGDADPRWGLTMTEQDGVPAIAYGDALGRLRLGEILRGPNGTTLNELATLRGHASRLRDGESIAVDPMTGELVTADISGAVRRWDLRRTVGHSAWLPTIGLTASPDGRYLFRTSYQPNAPSRNPRRGAITDVLDARTMERLYGLYGTTSREWFYAAAVFPAISPDGSRIVIPVRDNLQNGGYSSPDSRGSLRVHDVATGQTLFMTPVWREGQPERSAPYSASYTPDGTRFVVAGRRVILYDAQTFEEVASVEADSGDAEVTRVKYSPDGRWIVGSARGGVIHVYDPESLELVATAGPWGESTIPLPIEFLSADELLTLRRNEGEVAVLSLPGLEEVGGSGPLGVAASTMEVLPDGSRVLVAMANSTIRVLDPETWEQTLTLPLDDSGSPIIEVSADGREVFVALPGTLTRYDTVPASARADEIASARSERELASSFLEGLIARGASSEELHRRVEGDRGLTEGVRRAAREDLLRREDEEIWDRYAELEQEFEDFGWDRIQTEAVVLDGGQMVLPRLFAGRGLSPRLEQLVHEYVEFRCRRVVSLFDAGEDDSLSQKLSSAVYQGNPVAGLVNDQTWQRFRYVPGRAWRDGWVPTTEEDLGKAAALMLELVEKGGEGYFGNTAALLQYRLGNHEKALELTTVSMNWARGHGAATWPEDHLVRAMALGALGRNAEAKAELENINETMLEPGRYGGGEFLVLLAEAAYSAGGEETAFGVFDRLDPMLEGERNTSIGVDINIKCSQLIRDEHLESAAFLADLGVAYMKDRAVEDTYQTGGVLMVSAYAQQKLGNLETAEPLLRETLAIRREGIPPDDANFYLVANTMSILGEVVEDLGRPDEAEPLLVEAVDLYDAMRQRGSTANTRRTEAIRRLIEFYEERSDEALGDVAKAERLRAQYNITN